MPVYSPADSLQIQHKSNSQTELAPFYSGHPVTKESHPLRLVNVKLPSVYSLLLCFHSERIFTRTQPHFYPHLEMLPSMQREAILQCSAVMLFSLLCACREDCPCSGPVQWRVFISGGWRAGRASRKLALWISCFIWVYFMSVGTRGRKENRHYLFRHG